MWFCIRTWTAVSFSENQLLFSLPNYELTLPKKMQNRRRNVYNFLFETVPSLKDECSQALTPEKFE